MVEGKVGKTDRGPVEGEERGREDGEACEDGRGSPPSRIPLIPILRGGSVLAVGVLDSSASAEKGEALGGATTSLGRVERSTVRSEPTDAPDG